MANRRRTTKSRGKSKSNSGGAGATVIGILLLALLFSGLKDGTIPSGGLDISNPVTPPVAAPDNPAPVPPPADPAPQPPADPAPQPDPAPPASAALTQLASLPVKGKAAKTGYSRDKFGPAWKDVDGNGCDTRNDILQRDLTNITFKDNSRCTVATGTLHDTYTDKTIDFVRGTSTSIAVQIDHRIALANAWVTGAQQWDDAKRLQFANDPSNLIAVDGPTNGKKSDGDAATWLPPNKAYRCTYVATQVDVKAKYGLWVTQAEHDAMKAVLETC